MFELHSRAPSRILISKRCVSFGMMEFDSHYIDAELCQAVPRNLAEVASENVEHIYVKRDYSSVAKPYTFGTNF